MINRQDHRRLLSCAARLLSALLICILAGAVLLCAVYALPTTERAERNAAVSASVLYDEYYELHWNSLATQDMIAELIMLNTAVYRGDGSRAKAAMECARLLNEKNSDLVSLTEWLEGSGTLHKQTYERYWHGYLLFLKPALQLFDLGDIRGIIMIVESGMIAAMLYLLTRHGRAYLLLPYITAILLLYPTGLFQSMQYAPPFMLSHIGMILILIFGERFSQKDGFPLLFLLLGTSVVYFDLLTWPIAVLGLPLTLWYMLYGTDRLWLNVKRTVGLSACWCLGYAGMWGGKWVLASLVLKKGIGTIAFSSISERSGLYIGALGIQITRLSAVLRNIKVYLNWPFCLLALGLLVLWLILAIRNRFLHRLSGRLASVVPLLLIGLLPIVWYAALANHSYYHSFFTARALSVTAFSWFTAVFSLVAKQNYLPGKPAEPIPDSLPR